MKRRTSLATVESALMTARFLNMFHRNCDFVRLTCRSNMCNSLMDGIIQSCTLRRWCGTPKI
ncbi:MAG: hypothetical protein HRF45_03910 [Fimbriimonadia bacterium]